MRRSRAFSSVLTLFSLAGTAAIGALGCRSLSNTPTVSLAQTSSVSLNRNGLPWPENPTRFKVLPNYSWDAEFAKPGSAKLLPDYGSASVVQVNDSIDAAWRACRDIPFIRGEKVQVLWKRIAAKLQPVFADLGYKPSLAHAMVIRDAGIAAFIARNMRYGGTDQSIKLLRSDTINQIDYCTHPQAIPMANALLSQANLQGGCVDFASLTLALQAQAGIFSSYYSIVNRKKASDPVSFTTMNPQNHGIVMVKLPSKSTKWIPLAKLEKQMRWQDGTIPKKVSRAFYDSLFPVSEDPTLFDRMTDAEFRNPRFPRPHTLLVGAKGDDLFRLYAQGRYTTGMSMHDYESPFRVAGFKEGQWKPEAPLPDGYQSIFDAVERFRP